MDNHDSVRAGREGRGVSVLAARPVSAPSRSSSGRRAYYAANSVRILAQQRARREANIDKHRAADRAYVARNREMILARRRERYAANPAKFLAAVKAANAARPETARDYKLRRKYGIGSLEVQALLNSQGGVCAICGGTDWGKKGPVVDHSHTKGCVRGILCARCNLMLGHCKDSITTLRAAIDYLNADVH